MAANPGFAAAKVNLCLHITGRRPDGYHLLDSLVAFAGIGDQVTARLLPGQPAGGLTLSMAGAHATGLAGTPDNLVLRAAAALAAHHGVAPATALHLDKRLPVASGIGGGSADAAATLNLLADVWGATAATRAALPGLAARLGADVPACLASRPVRMRGIGDELTPICLPSFGLLLANPGRPVATQAVFAARAASGHSGSGPLPPLPGFANAAALARWLHDVGNDLQAPAIALCPPIATVLAQIGATPGCLLARMSGSGATCLGLYATAALAQAAAVQIGQSGWWCWGGAAGHSAA